MSGLKKLNKSISDDLAVRFPSQRLTQRRKLSELVSAMLMCQTPNLMELSNVLDRPSYSMEARYNYVERFIKNDLVDHAEVMSHYAKDLLLRLSKHQDRIFLMIDQSRINDNLQLLMVSVRVNKRALPILWYAEETEGAIGFSAQEKVLDIVDSWLPKGVNVLLAGDRFYGCANLIKWCQNHNWKYRLRLRGNLTIKQQDKSKKATKKSLDMLKLEGAKYIKKADMVAGSITDIGILHEKGHKEAWYIAMDDEDTKSIDLKIRDYSKRWGIENMFSDFKSRGFSLTDSKLRFADRLERLVLVASIAFHWAVSVGMLCKKNFVSTKNKKVDQVYQFLNAVYVNSNAISHYLEDHHLYGFY